MAIRHLVAPWCLFVSLLSGGCYDLAALGSVDAGAAGLCQREPVPCSGAALLCDGFELASATNFPGWAVHLGDYLGASVDPGTEALAVTTPVCRGQKTLSARTVGSTEYAILQRAVTVPNPAYLRFYYFQPSSSDPPSGFETVQLSNASAFGQLTLDRDGAAWSYGTSVQHFTAAPVHDRWTCVELMVKVDATAGAVSLSIDEAPVGSYSGIDTQIPGGALDVVTIGTTVGMGVQGAVQVYYDDFVLSAAPIGC